MPSSSSSSGTIGFTRLAFKGAKSCSLMSSKGSVLEKVMVMGRDLDFFERYMTKNMIKTTPSSMRTMTPTGTKMPMIMDEVG